jgi:serine protease Do
MRATALLFILLPLLFEPVVVRADVPTTRPKPPATAPSRAVLLKPLPDNLQDLRALQTQVEAVMERVSPAVVGLRTGGSGSGVIISDDGYVLTAGHVTGSPGRTVMVILNNGRIVRGKALGINYGMDSGLVQITDPPPDENGWPHVDLGTSADLKKGQWCIALGHPGGFKVGRTPPLRLGRILDIRGNFLRTDCALVGGDSGGPLFDLDGRVIGIHSRIGGSLNDNMHVPIDTFRQTWDRLAKGDGWGANFAIGRPGAPYLGFQVDPEAADARVGQIFPRSPAEAAGLKKGDVITRFGGEPIANSGELLIRLARKKPGDEVPIEIKREDKTMTLKVTIGKRPQ